MGVGSKVPGYSSCGAWSRHRLAWLPADCTRPWTARPWHHQPSLASSTDHAPLPGCWSDTLIEPGWSRRARPYPCPGGCDTAAVPTPCAAPPAPWQLPARRPPLPACRRAWGSAGRTQCGTRLPGRAGRTRPAGCTGRCLGYGSPAGSPGRQRFNGARCLLPPPSQARCGGRDARRPLSRLGEALTGMPADTLMPAPARTTMSRTAPLLIRAATPSRSKLASLAASGLGSRLASGVLGACSGRSSRDSRPMSGSWSSGTCGRRSGRRRGAGWTTRAAQAPASRSLKL